MQRKIWIKAWLMIGIAISLWGCATPKDVEILDREIQQLYSQQTKENDSLKNELRALRADFAAETKKLQTDLLVRLESLQGEIRNLTAEMEDHKTFLKRPSREIELLRGDVAFRIKTLEEKTKALEEKNKVQEEKHKTQEEKNKALEERTKTQEGKNKTQEEALKGIEDRLKALDGKLDRMVSKVAEVEKSMLPKEPPSEVKVVSTGAGDVYKDAYETFHRGDLEGARRKFEAFLKQYPNTELSDNAQFWIGEIYFLKKDFERAILEYEKTMVKYPEGDKLPAALFKQALAFLELGEKTNARSLLRRVIERYPHSDQAEMAKRKLDALR